MSLGKTIVDKATNEAAKVFGAAVARKTIEKPVERGVDIIGGIAGAGYDAFREGLKRGLVRRETATDKGVINKFMREKGNKKGMISDEPVMDASGTWHADFYRKSDNPIINAIYKNPDLAADVGAVGIPLGLAGAGLATYFATKPKSDYALGLGASTGNSNIDAARASAYYQQQTAQMKFDHQMQLQNARQQAQTPGRQAYGNALGVGLPDQLGGSPRDAYNMAASIVGAQSPIYK